MAKRLLIDASHTEEVRVALVNDKLLEEFDAETTTKKITKGNIYLAKVVRVEPSLQAAFVEYGNGRQGFLSFSEIHSDYYQIPVSERREDVAPIADEAILESLESPEPLDVIEEFSQGEPNASYQEMAMALDPSISEELQPQDGILDDTEIEADSEVNPEGEDGTEIQKPKIRGRRSQKKEKEVEVKRQPRYKIQEVIKRRQILLVQVVKEERGNKGAAVTTYLSLAGRYCVLMPNAHKKVIGVSRKIDDSVDRTRLKELINSLSVPDGMSLIIRTAGQERRKPEIKRDYEYLVSLWNQIRDKTLKSIAPALIHEEGDLVTRAIRDMYTTEVDDVLIEGEDAYKSARNLMKQMIPSHVKKVQIYKNPELPLFHAYNVETQLENMMQQRCALPSGGYIIISPTEALVSIDINSGKSTRERNIDETALNTNLEAADEIARQLRLRDLSGLVVIDFIDMQENKHIQQVERRLKEATRMDRARIQIGRISQFGLLEMSRQRLKPSLIENYTSQCVYCHGSGHVRSVESSVLQILRAIEGEAIKGGGITEIITQVPKDVDLYLLNKKRMKIVDIEKRFNLSIVVERDDSLITPLFNIDVIKGRILSGTQDSAEVVEVRHEIRSEPRPQARPEQRQMKKPMGNLPEKKHIHKNQIKKEPVKNELAEPTTVEPFKKGNPIESAIIAEISGHEKKHNNNKKRNFKHRRPQRPQDRAQEKGQGAAQDQGPVQENASEPKPQNQSQPKVQPLPKPKSQPQESTSNTTPDLEAPKKKKAAKGWLRRLLDN